jgi:predicted small integral membrane protein
VHIRYSKIAMVLSLAAFALLVAFNNIVDYGSNFAFVQHVLSMNTTFPGNRLISRAILAPGAWHAAYWLIIAGEAAAGLCLLIGGVAMLMQRRADTARFDAAKKWTVIGATLGFLVWFFGFMVVGGEWFLMWQSETWNGQDAAFKFTMAILGVLIYVSLPECEAGLAES